MLASSLFSTVVGVVLEVLALLALGFVPSALLAVVLWSKFQSAVKGNDQVRKQHEHRMRRIKVILEAARTPSNTEKLLQLLPARLAVEQKIHQAEMGKRIAPVQIAIGGFGFFMAGSFYVTNLIWFLVLHGEVRSFGFSWILVLVPTLQMLSWLYVLLTAQSRLAEADTTLRLINVQLLDAGVKLPTQQELDATASEAPVDNAATVATTGA